MIEIDSIATVEVDGRLITGRVYHVRANGWPCVESEGGRQASGPLVEPTEQELDDFLAGFLECGLWADLHGLPCPDCSDFRPWPAVRSKEGCDRCSEHPGYSAESGAGNDWPDWVDEVADEAHEKMREECADFLRANLADLREYCEIMGDWTGDDGSTPAAMARAGHDFWLTRNDHGAGFWDRGLGELGDRLTEASRPYGESYLYVGDDGKVYA